MILMLVSVPMLAVVVVVLGLFAVGAYAIVQLYRESQKTNREQSRLEHKRRVLREQRDYDALLEFADGDHHPTNASEQELDDALRAEGIDPEDIETDGGMDTETATQTDMGAFGDE